MLHSLVRVTLADAVKKGTLPRAIELQPDSTLELAESYISRSAAYIELGRFDEALADADAAIELDPPLVLALAEENRRIALEDLGLNEAG